MHVYVFIATAEGHAKPASLDALCYGRMLADKARVAQVSALVIGQLKVPEELGRYGATEVVCVGEVSLSTVDQQVAALRVALPKAGAFTLIFSRTLVEEQIAARLSIFCEATLVTGVLNLPEVRGEDYLLQRGVYTGKAFETVQMKGVRRVLCIQQKVVVCQEDTSLPAAVLRQLPFVFEGEALVKQLKQQKSKQTVPLQEAEVVVSGGRGMKSPENWHLIEELATILGGATACSKPVSDMEWRPHYEHVGQTGLKVAPKLYIAVGISGAVQHLAGVSNAKVVVVINKDPDAPFFQAADCGIVGDALEVLPKLIFAVKKLCL